MNTCCTFLFILLSLLSLSPLSANASSGDRAPAFQACLANCTSTACAQGQSWAAPPSLRLTRWTCADDCAYACMHAAADAAQAHGERVQQYYGKWPFWRLAGMQEPAAVLFSLLNLWAHRRGYRLVKRRVPGAHPLKGMLMAWGAVSMVSWTFSAVFHTRDWPSTEKLDYFAAAAVFLVALYTVVLRFFFTGRLNNSPLRRLLARVWALTCIGAFTAHVTYLTLLPRFDYSYNITFNLAIGLAHNALWLLYALPSSLTVLRRFPPTAGVPRAYRPRCATKVAVCVGLTMAAMALELLDFPPVLRVLDAHALWHAATVPIVRLWYEFLLEDALDEGWNLKQLS